MPKASPKIVIVGAGGVTFPLTLSLDIFSQDSLKGATLSLYDIAEPRLHRTAGMVRKVIAGHKLPAKLEVTTNRAAALRGADYVIVAFQVGGIEAYKIDKEVSKKYGIDLCVGDTLNAGGVFRGLRSLGALAGIAADMKRYCPDALVLNYANPMAINCWGLNNLGIRVVGLCHSVQGTTKMLAQAIKADYADVNFKCYGINHQAWITEFNVKGRDAYPKLRKTMYDRFPSPGIGKDGGVVKIGGSLAVDHDPNVYYHERVRTEIMRTFGYFQTESSHHGSEYVPWFRKDAKTIKAYIKQRWDYYECNVNFDLKGQLAWADKVCQAKEPLVCSEEYGARIINAMETGAPTVIYGNVPNWGAPGTPTSDRTHLIPNLPQNACVEVACLVDRNGVQPTAHGPLPPQLAAINRTNVNVQELAVLAHETGDPALVEQAVALDPLTGVHLTLPQIRALVADSLRLQRRWLPQFKHVA